MPSKSQAQHNLMAAVANNPKFAKKAGIPQTVGADYMKADKKVKKYNMGGMANAKKTMRNLDDEVYRIDTEKAMERRKMNMGGSVMKYKAGGCVGDGMAIRGRTKGRMV
jgi:hypothetical protein